ncbi:GNAT family N-acetyltransferase, partial [archaeon D22]
MQINIRKARADEHKILTEISFASKRHWDYPEAFFDIWKDELTITKEYIEKNMVYVVESSNTIVGYFSIVEVKEKFLAGKLLVTAGFWLEHIFIDPKHINKGIGTQMIAYINNLCKEKSIRKLKILSDPNS